ncbi:lipoprotein [Roseovarius nubinhibens]|uniref:Lipoprotein, putative n=1 Tax=Roseovarius nubinhibens (strain ATCC BAA-591 / DSM 15170 / ISM) TaxID=89187 RepID=A3SN27_ROSNI|nr:lipoprotein [Roseovarius nubinhibens]EAP75867.1 lipoprotein, putative [Roseovarius nubinhibens ISM]
MRILLSILMVTTLTLAGCGGLRDSKLNPGNWFGKSTARATPTSAQSPNANPLIPEERNSIFRRKRGNEVYEGTLVHQVTGLSVERASGGAIIRVTGLPLRQGAHDVRLTSANGKDDAPINGVLTYRLEAYQPVNRAQGTPHSRKVSAGRFVSDQDLQGVREIRVISQTNSHSSRR